MAFDFIKRLKGDSQSQISERHLPGKDESIDEPIFHDESNWLISYADMMTLLCAFFIMLFSLSKLDEPKYEKVKQEVAKTFKGEYHPPAKELEQEITQVIQEAGVQRETTLKSDAYGVSLSFQSTLFFDTLSAEINDPGKTVLAKVIQGVLARQQKDLKKYKIVVEGHTDSRPILSGGFATNWELSGARASRVVRLFIDKGFSAQHLTAIGYADTQPEVVDRNPAGVLDDSALAKNRRVVIRILEPKVEAIPFPEPATPAAPATSAH